MSFTGIDYDQLKESGIDDIWGFYLAMGKMDQLSYKNISNITGNKMKKSISESIKSILEFFYSMNCITRLDQIVSTIEIYDEKNNMVEVPVNNLDKISPGPFFPNNKFEFDLETLLAAGGVNKTFGIR